MVHRLPRTKNFCCITIIILLMSQVSAWADEGKQILQLDAEFGETGRVLTQPVKHGLTADFQSDGKLIVAGMEEYQIGCASYDQSLIVTRYFADGTLDESFGEDGTVTTYIGPDALDIRDIKIQPDDKILIAGHQMIEAPSSEFGFEPVFRVTRYTADGRLDKDFGTEGVVNINFKNSDDCVASILLQPDGKIILAGSTGTTNVFGDFGLARLNMDGTLDQSFGRRGTVTTSFRSREVKATRAAWDEQGRIVMSGYTREGEIILARYQANGRLDRTFGRYGKIVNQLPDIRSTAYDLKLLPNGKILVTGKAEEEEMFANQGVTIEGTNFLLARFNNDGKLDTQFGEQGFVCKDLGGYDEGFKILTDDHDRILVAAGANINYSNMMNNTNQYALLRYDLQGNPDGGFGDNGVWLRDDTELKMHEIMFVETLSDGQYLLGGSTIGAGSTDYVLERYMMMFE